MYLFTFDHLEQGLKSEAERKIMSYYKNQRGNQSHSDSQINSNKDDGKNNHSKN